MKFTKVEASGNDFIIIDNKNGKLNSHKLNWGKMAKDICRRRYSIGADGLLVLERSDKADFKMRIINPDGSEVTMCGNGIRASALYAAKSRWGKSFIIETGAGIISAKVNGKNIKVKLSDPCDVRFDIKLNIDVKKIMVHYINTGVPHVVHMVKDLDKYPVKDIGNKIREHKTFAPKGTNVDFVRHITRKRASVRTYERGVEDETLACGTGVVASALILGLLGLVLSPVEIETHGGEILKVYYKISRKKITDVYLEGRAKIVYEGRI